MRDVEQRRAEVAEARADLADYPDSDGRVRRLARALVLYGLAMSFVDEFEPAREALVEGRGLQERVVAYDPDDARARGFIATIDERLADVYDSLDAIFSARRTLESAVGVRREVVRRSSGDPETIADLAKSLTGLALHLRLNGAHDATERINEAVTTARQACEGPRSSAKARRVLADALEEQSDAYRFGGDGEASLAACLERVHVLQPLADDPETTNADQAECATALRDLAEASVRRRDLVAAREAAEEAVERLEELTKNDPSQLTWFEFGRALGTAASIATEQGRLGEAEDLFDRLERLTSRLRANDDPSAGPLQLTLAGGRLRLAVRRRDVSGWVKRLSDFSRAMSHAEIALKTGGKSRRNYVNRSFFGSDNPTLSGAAKLLARIVSAFATHLAALSQARLGIRIPGLPAPAPAPPPGVPDDPSDLDH